MRLTFFAIDGERQALSFDWVTGNIYVASDSGFILACDGKLEKTFPYAELLPGQGEVNGIAVNPIERWVSTLCN